jgi:UDP-glucose:(heptosyl)LPS alpha-1,3-glucosyltransferase
MDKKLFVVQVVRRLGPVGGMESYVWNLTRQLALMQFKIIVICEEVYEHPHEAVEVRSLGGFIRKPRWLSLFIFSIRVARTLRGLLVDSKYRYFSSYSDSSLRLLIHSHERIGVHHITTFHGPPFANVLSRPFFKLISPRIWMHLFMERREVCGKSVCAVVPNSSVIGAALNDFYPCSRKRLTAPIPPGVADLPIRAYRKVDPKGGVMGFVGKEWRRKGLDLFFRVAASLLITRPNLKVLILGPERKEIAHLISGFAGHVDCPGWQRSDNFYQDMDLLLHPAKSEPYGMAVAEAMSASVPVVLSDCCGVAADVASTNGQVLPLDSSISEWTVACDNWLSINKPPPVFRRSWSDVADEYVAVYERVAADLQRQGL